MLKKLKEPVVKQSTALNFMYQVRVLNHLDFENEWSGWKMRGKFLVSPQGDRILPQRLAGLVFTESLRIRGQKKTSAAVPMQPNSAPPAVAAFPERRRHVA